MSRPPVAAVGLCCAIGEEAPGVGSFTLGTYWVFPAFLSSPKNSSRPPISILSPCSSGDGSAPSATPFTFTDRIGATPHDGLAVGAHHQPREHALRATPGEPDLRVIPRADGVLAGDQWKLLSLELDIRHQHQAGVKARTRRARAATRNYFPGTAAARSLYYRPRR